MKKIISKAYKFLNIIKGINIKKYKLSAFLKYINFYKHINLKPLNVKIIYRYFDLKIFKYLDIRRYNFSKLYKYLDLNTYKNVPSFLSGLIIFTIVAYLSTPLFFEYDKSKIENLICKGLNAKCVIKGKINYSFIPSPRIKIRNLEIKNSANKKTSIAKISKLSVTLSLLHLTKIEKIKYKKIKLKKAEFNINLKDFQNKKSLFIKNKDLMAANITKSKIIFYDGKNYVATISNADLKYTVKEKKNEMTLKGKFLEDDIYINFENNKIKKNLTKIFTAKLPSLRLFTKIKLLETDSKENAFNGDILFKKDKNRITALFDYKNNKILINKANLRNVILDGEFTGEINFFPYFDFNLDVNLNGINFIKLNTAIANLDDKQKQNLFKINEKINGKLIFSANKIYSKYNLIKSFESRLKFVNGDILIEQLLLNLGKIGAADIIGVIKNSERFSNLKFEKNIFIDNKKRFLNKFKIYNKKEIPSNLFVEGNIDLRNFNARFFEISSDKKMKSEDISYIEKEFNDLLFEDGLVSFLNFLNLKEFLQVVLNENDNPS